MKNRCKTLLRDHSVPEVTTEGLPKARSVSAIPETLTIRGPKRPPINGGESGTSLGAISKINCKIEIGKKTFKQTFLVCENLTRSLILGVDFAKQHAAGVHWTKHKSFVLTIDGETEAETKELHNKAAVSLKKRTKLPPRSCAEVERGYQHHQHR